MVTELAAERPTVEEAKDCVVTALSTLTANRIVRQNPGPHSAVETAFVTGLRIALAARDVAQVIVDADARAVAGTQYEEDTFDVPGFIETVQSGLRGAEEDPNQTAATYSVLGLTALMARKEGASNGNDNVNS